MKTMLIHTANALDFYPLQAVDRTDDRDICVAVEEMSLALRVQQGVIYCDIINNNLVQSQFYISMCFSLDVEIPVFRS